MGKQTGYADGWRASKDQGRSVWLPGNECSLHPSAIILSFPRSKPAVGYLKQFSYFSFCQWLVGGKD